MFISKNITTHQTNKNAFTLIELLVVIVIIGVLATLTTISLTSARGKARDARRISDLKQIATALELYQADNNSYPSLITGGNALINPSDATKVYMKKVPSDPSTNTSYAYYGSTSRFTLRTTIEKSVDNIPVGPVIITNNAGARQALNTDNSFMNPDLTFGALVGHWALDGNTGTRDLVGTANGIIPNGISTSTGRFGESLGAYLFNGTNQYVDLGDVHDLTDAVTVTAWVNCTKTPHVGQGSGIISKGLSTNGYVASYETIIPLNMKPHARVFTNAIIFTESSVVIGFNTWNFVALTYDKVSVKNYINGVNVASTPSALAMQLNDTNLTIGVRSYHKTTPNTSQFGGSIADARVYSKALNADEISYLYNATKP